MKQTCKNQNSEIGTRSRLPSDTIYKEQLLYSRFGQKEENQWNWAKQRNCLLNILLLLKLLDPIKQNTKTRKQITEKERREGLEGIYVKVWWRREEKGEDAKATVENCSGLERGKSFSLYIFMLFKVMGNNNSFGILIC